MITVHNNILHDSREYGCIGDLVNSNFCDLGDALYYKAAAVNGVYKDEFYTITFS